jgi:CHASE3 domain sensor protein
VLAGVTVLIALLALYIGILQLRNEYQKRYEARQLENDLIELEAEISKVSKIGHQAHMK